MTFTSSSESLSLSTSSPGTAIAAALLRPSAGPSSPLSTSRSLRARRSASVSKSPESFVEPPNDRRTLLATLASDGNAAASDFDSGRASGEPSAKCD